MAAPSDGSAAELALVATTLEAVGVAVGCARSRPVGAGDAAHATSSGSSWTWRIGIVVDAARDVGAQHSV